MATSGLIVYQDPQARFSVAAPPDRARLDQPAVPFGSGFVEFRDAAAGAGLSVALDSNGGTDINMRAFQVAVLTGQTAYILTGSARAE